jgi:molecular chaperone HtpG
MSRCHKEQKTIYYLSGRTRDDIEKGPYLETFLKRGVEVLYCLEPIDDFIMTTLAEYEGKKLMSGDSASVDLPPVKHEEKETPIISYSDNRKFTQWMKDVLGDRVSDVRKTERIFNRPAIIVNSDTTITTTMHRVMKATGKDLGFSGKIVLEINPDHPIITALKKLRDGTTDKGFLNSCVEQIYDNALAESGLLDDPRPMVERIYALMERALQSEDKGAETH